MATFDSTLKPILIYVYRINDAAHKGTLKIGETTTEMSSDYLVPNSKSLNDAAHKRIQACTKTASVQYELLYTEGTLYTNKDKTISSFTDHQVQKILERSGIKKKDFGYANQGVEWYETDLETVKRAIAAAKQGRSSLNSNEVTNDKDPIVFRPEQRDAINRTIKRFAKSSKMLWNAKMRFGKTLCTLQVIREMNLNRSLIITHRPVVDKSWFEDFGKVFYDKADYYYGSRNKGEKLSFLVNSNHKYVYFASIQDLRGSEQVGGKFDKNNEIFSTEWDLVVIDEAHEGTQTELGQSVIRELTKSKSTKVLQLSGTPFNLLDDIDEDDVYTWDYVMEQKAKAEWDATHMGDINPYESLPAISIYTYNLGTLMNDYADDEKAFNFHEFFRTDEDGNLIHNEDIDRFLNLLCRNDNGSLYPYANEKFRNIFHHTLWILPGVAAAKAVSAKLRNHPVFSAITIVNVAGNGDDDEENSNALEMVEKAIGPNPEESYTITLSCGRLTTGVTVRPWTGVFMMAGSYNTSAAGYMQTIFRVQSPYVKNGKMKTNCYAFDFAPDRTLRVLAEAAKVSAKAGKTTESDRRILGDFLNFCPIISVEGSRMSNYDVETMMSQLKRAQIEKVVQCGFENGALYNDELMKLTDIDLKEFEKLKKTIGTTKAMPRVGDIEINNQGFTNEEYAEKEKLEKKKKKKTITPEEQKRLDELKQKRTQKEAAISILRGISIRMPLLIYGAELKNENDEITIDNFANLIDDESWKEFMPAGVTKSVFEKFKKYYEADVFRESGKRIRSMARVADRFSIEERITRIATLFNTFRNPDKETVLTPWRVVNMHLGDCLGGYNFYDTNWRKMLETPRLIDNGDVTKCVFGEESQVLEINSKSGLYPLYVAYSIYRSRWDAMKRLYGKIDREFALSLWDSTVANNIFVVCKTPMARSITKRTLVGFRDVEVNARYYKDLIKTMKDTPSVFVNAVRDGKRYWKKDNVKLMKFNAIVGNPPYQLTGGSGGTNDAPIYQYFCLSASRLKPSFVSLIIPAKWFAAGRDALLKEFREHMLTSKKVREMFAYPDSHELFATVEIKGGVCYYREDNDQGLCKYTLIEQNRKETSEVELDAFDILIRNPKLSQIVDKVCKHSNSVSTVESIWSSDTPFGIPTKPTDNKKNIFTISQYNNGEYDTCLHYLDKNVRQVAYVRSSDIHKNAQDVDKVKVFIPEAGGSGNDAIILGKPILAPAKSVCSQTYIYTVVPDEEYGKNLITYLKTKFLRVLVSAVKITQHATANVYRFVPLQDFTSSSDIDWTKPANEIDRQLYSKYGLTDDEVEFIENTIKPMS